MRAFEKGYGTCDEVADQSDTWEEYLQKKYTLQEARTPDAIKVNHE